VSFWQWHSFALYTESEIRKIMGDIGYIFGYAIVGAFLLGAVVGYFVEKIGEKICGKEH
jgi:hypothetical protein